MITTDTGEAYENEFHHAIDSPLPEVQLASMINPENDPFHGKPDAGGAAGPLSRPTPEYVDRAALKYKDQVVTGEKGSAHFDLMDKIPKDAKYLDVDDGFVTNTGRYITRKEALMMGGKRGQIDPETFEKSLQKGSGAISEDFADINRARWEKRINMMEEMQKKKDRWDDLLLPEDKEDILKGLKDYVKDKFK